MKNLSTSKVQWFQSSETWQFEVQIWLLIFDWRKEMGNEGDEEGVENQSARRERNYKARVFRAMADRHQRKLIWSLNARCVSIGLVLALSNCSESGGEPDAMLDIHHPGTGLESHHQQFHNSYGNIKIHHFNTFTSIARPPSSPRGKRLCI